MRKILITGDDGPTATGTKVLRDHAKNQWPQARIVQVTTAKQHSGASFSCTQGGWELWKTAVPTEIDNNTYAFDLSPIDVLARCFLGEPIYDSQPWDLVLCGVNHGSNVGFDVYHSATVALAMTAATAYGTAAMAFSQDLPSTAGIFDPNLDRKAFLATEKVLPDFLRRTLPKQGDCYNVNFPVNLGQGYRQAKVAHYSRFRTPPTTLIPRASDEQSDITLLQAGFVTVSQLQLRVNPPQTYA